MFTTARDALTSQAARTFLNQRLARYGEVERLKLDSRNKSAEIVLRLIGEDRPVAVTVDRYEIIERDGQKFLRLAQCTANRAWLQNVLADYGPGREIALPAWAASAL